MRRPNTKPSDAIKTKKSNPISTKLHHEKCTHLFLKAVSSKNSYYYFYASNGVL